MPQLNEKKTVLLVDDEPANIQIVNSILKDAYKIRVATSGAKALELVSATPPPDLILLDVIMPEMDGYEVCTRLKAALETKDIPVVFLTAQTETSDETKGFDVGAVDYIHKPFSPAVVQARVNTHLTLRGIRQQLAQQLSTMKEELETARKIQFSILPHQLPTIENVQLAARYVPMTEVAGDFYDFIVIDEKHLGIFVADVSGHGMPAALIASMLKIALAAQAEWGSDPARVLTGLNQSLCGKFHDHYVTAAYVYLDMEKRILRYGGAGHPPIFICDGATGSARKIAENGFFLSWMPDAAYSSVEVPLVDGDWVFIYTDGISETVSRAGEEFGLERIREFIEVNSFLGPEELATKLLDEVQEWSGRGAGEQPDDDITLVAAHIKDLDLIINK
jgi:sigma-B regulation protein RsbU (phosphoserine phosphatase)